MEVKTLDDLYVESLQDLYSAESQLIEALPKIAEAVETEELRDAVLEHLEQTKEQANRLEMILRDLGEDPGGTECKAMKGLLEEGKELMKTVEKGPVCDAALIGAAQKVEHYEIAGYGTARTFASLLGRDEDVEALQMTLDEEAQADSTLTDLAEGIVNDQAAEADDEDSNSESSSQTKAAGQ